MTYVRNPAKSLFSVGPYFVISFPDPMSMRSMVLAVFVLGLLGTGGELLFLGHTQGLNQLIPIVLMVMSLLVLGWHGLERKSASLRTFQITMVFLGGRGNPGYGVALSGE